MTEKSKTYCLLTIITLKIKPKMNNSKKQFYNGSFEHMNI